ncbi:MAG: hypothetical protein ABIR57_07750 [Aeromicrobium sp.]
MLRILAPHMHRGGVRWLFSKLCPSPFKVKLSCARVTNPFLAAGRVSWPTFGGNNYGTGPIGWTDGKDKRQLADKRATERLDQRDTE